MLKVGLTGGIASGKSFVTGLLRELGCETLDADLTAHRVMEPGQPAHAAIVKYFGEKVLDAEGRIDRTLLGPLVFADPEARATLNAIVHPRVYQLQAEWLATIEERDPSAIAVIDAALMIETGSWRRFDCIVVVHCRPEIQLERLMARNQMSRSEAQNRIAAQLSTAEKLARADFDIDTSEGFDDTRRQVLELIPRLRDLAARQEPTPQSVAH
ncbi:MAG: dephospho-CoA kinase [Acidobacteria bacterium]|nr:dephospho-CoA kinase [Acidobacteriota bacterium]